MDLPSHPDADDSTDAPDQATGRPGPRRLLVAAVIVLVVVVIVLHLTGVIGPGAG
jgi:hypothetical protein